MNIFFYLVSKIWSFYIYLRAIIHLHEQTRNLKIFIFINLSHRVFVILCPEYLISNSSHLFFIVQAFIIIYLEYKKAS